jgi:hypothetical protein
MRSTDSETPPFKARSPFVLFMSVVSFWQPTYSHFDVPGYTLAVAAEEVVVCARDSATRNAIRTKMHVGIREDAMVCLLGRWQRCEGRGEGF